MAWADRNKGNEKSRNSSGQGHPPAGGFSAGASGPGFFSAFGYFDRFSQDEVVFKIFNYLSRHPESMAELELGILDEEHPELVPRDVPYVVRKGIENPKALNDSDLDYLSKELADKYIFMGKAKRNFIERTAEGSLKLLLKNYLSDRE